MKKNIVRWWMVLLIALVVYNVVVFAVPFVKTGVFFLSWIFTLAAIAAQVYVIRSAFYNGESVKSKFYGFPIAKIGMVYLIIQVVLSLLFMAVGRYVALWIPFVVYVVLLGVSAVGFISADDLRISDPVSSDALSDIEADLTAYVDELQNAVTDGDCTAVHTLLDKAEAALAERNRLCKLNK